MRPTGGAGALTVVLVVAACGGTTPTATDPATRPSTTGGENGPRITLRVQAAPGARYSTTSRIRTEAESVVVLTESVGALAVESVDAEAGTLVVRSTVRSIRQFDETGRPVEFPIAEVDLTGVSFRRTMDHRGAVVGRVEASGMTPTSAQFAETTRATLEQGFIKLPEAPVRAGDSWADRMHMRIPVEGELLEMACDVDYRMTGTEGQGDTLAARLEFDAVCEVPPTVVAEGRGSLAITSRSAGWQIVSIRDGLTGTLSVGSDTTTTIQIAGESAPRVSRMRQEILTETTPLVD